MNELQKIVNEVKYRTGQTLDEISEVVGYARSYLNNEINKGDNDTIKKKLIDKYGKKLIDYWGSENKNVLNDPPAEYAQPMTIEVMNNLTKSNLNISESNKSIARSNEELVSILKAKMSSTEPESKTFSEMVATVLALREYTVDLAAAVNYQTPDNALKELGKMAKSHLNKNYKDSGTKDGK